MEQEKTLFDLRVCKRCVWCIGWSDESKQYVVDVTNPYVIQHTCLHDVNGMVRLDHLVRVPPQCTNKEEHRESYFELVTKIILANEPSP